MRFGTWTGKKPGEPKRNIAAGVLCLIVVLGVFLFSTAKPWEIRAENALERSIVIESLELDENLRIGAVSGERYEFSSRYYDDAFLKKLSGQLAPGDEIALRVIGRNGIAAIEKEGAELLPLEAGLGALKIEAKGETLLAVFLTAVSAGIIIDGIVRLKKRKK